MDPARGVGLVGLGDHQVDDRRDGRGAARLLSRRRRMEDGDVDGDVRSGSAHLPQELDSRQPVPPGGRRARRGREDVQLPEKRQLQAGWKRSRQAPGIGNDESLEVGQTAQPGRNRARQRGTGEAQRSETGEVSQPRRDRTGQRGMREVERLEVHQASELGRDRPRQRGTAEAQHYETGQVPQPRRNRTGQVVAAQEEVLEVHQASELGRDRAGQVVVAEVQPPEVGQVPQPRRDRAGQVVAGDVQPSRCSSLPSSAGMGPVKSLCSKSRTRRLARRPSSAGMGPIKSPQLEHQHLELAKAAQCGRDRTGQAVRVEQQSRDATVGIGGHSMPISQWRRRLPVPAVLPARAAGRVEEHLEHLAVALRAGGLGGRHCHGLGRAQAAGVARGHRHRRRPRRPRHEPDGVAGRDRRDRALGWCGPSSPGPRSGRRASRAPPDRTRRRPARRPRRPDPRRARRPPAAAAPGGSGGARSTSMPLRWSRSCGTPAADTDGGDEERVAEAAAPARSGHSTAPLRPRARPDWTTGPTRGTNSREGPPRGERAAGTRIA